MSTLYDDEIPPQADVGAPTEFQWENLLPSVLREAQGVDDGKVLNDTTLNPQELQERLNQASANTVGIWVALSRSMQATFKEQFEDFLDALLAIRATGPKTETAVLTRTARMLGFDFAEDVLEKMAEQNLRELLPQLPMFGDYAPTARFTKFLELLFNGAIHIESLWTQDYIDFRPEPGGPLLTEGGTWFATTHVNINLDWVGYQDSVAQLAGNFATARGRELLDKFLPLNLVIEHLGFYATVTISLSASIKLVRAKNRARIHIGVQDSKLDRVKTSRTVPVSI